MLSIETSQEKYSRNNEENSKLFSNCICTKGLKNTVFYDLCMKVQII